TLLFAARALELAQDVPHDDALARATDAIDGGAALERFGAMIAAQGGDPRVLEDPEGVLPRAPVREPIVADRSGFLASVRAEEIGLASVALGAGRLRKGDRIDSAVGMVFRPKIGDRLEAGAELGEVHARDREAAAGASARVLGAIDVADDRVEPPPLVHVWM
ncbi:MAG TPA: thymidine phosphorylase, partial [Actinomycetota bacterium]|nr:thymidine phosphorylase [Actinomycetota bacterium]